jgi:hypothetical protein
MCPKDVEHCCADYKSVNSSEEECAHVSPCVVVCLYIMATCAVFLFTFFAISTLSLNFMYALDAMHYYRVFLKNNCTRV